MNYVGISSGFHDAAMAVINHDEITWAAHDERTSKQKHHKHLTPEFVAQALEHVVGNYSLHYYERPWLRALRHWRAGQPIPHIRQSSILGPEIMNMFEHRPWTTHAHHLSHAAAQFQTSPYYDATVVVIDAIGEFDTITIWHADYDGDLRARYKQLWHQRYPNSIGLFYSAMTQRVGLKPLDEEYILMGMAAWGKNNLYPVLKHDLIKDIDTLEFKQNLHTGINANYLEGADAYDIAASSQKLVEDLITTVMFKARQLGTSKNLCYGGGVALNCTANRLLGRFYDNIWIMPNPGDAGSALGAALLGHGGQVAWTTAYLGNNIKGAYPVTKLLQALDPGGIVGVANGRAEFGPRALGNRSLLADPRGPNIKDRVNEIKQRQQFRPFAPVILEEHVHNYFNMPVNWSNSRYMQVVADCRRPDLFPAIVHRDGTSRVQTVPQDGSGIRQLLEAWYARTGCPMLLNTSLNIRGQAMVDDEQDAMLFEQTYGIRVYTKE